MFKSIETFTQAIRSRLYEDKNKRVIQRVLDTIGYDYGHWTRTVMYRECFRLIEELDPGCLEALEISAGHVWRQLRFKSYSEANYPEFDICQARLPGEYDIIIADQIFEHLLWPYRAGRNVYSMLKPGGYFMVTTPFLIRVHDVPVDCSRWTELGMKHLLAECGFPIDTITTGSWGNRACVKANFNKWARQGWFGSLRNEPDFPVAVWALARKGG